MEILEIRKSLKNLILGDVLWDEEILKFYSVDSSFYQTIPKIVVVPKTEKDVILAVKFATKNKISITVRGAGTGLVGGALTENIVLDLKNLNKIKIKNDYAYVGTGVIKGILDRELKSKGKFFPPNPSIGPFCAIGGMIGNNASGSRTLKYGSTIDNIQEITFVDGRGRKITLPENHAIGKKITKFAKKIKKKYYPKVSKNSCGYRLDCVNSIKETHKVFIGSEGTLGIILSAKLCLKKIPSKRLLFVVEYTSPKSAAIDCIKIKKTFPSAIEFVDKPTLENIDFKFKKNTNCLLFVEYDSNIQKNEKTFFNLISGKLVKKLMKQKEIEKWWKYRDLALSYSLKSIKKENQNPHLIEDATVPLEKLAKLFSIIEKLGNKFQIRTVMYGHAGNGNIHLRIVSGRQKSKQLEKISKWYFNQIFRMGGTISGEHGDGIARSNFVKKQYGEKNYQVFKKFKKYLDPKNILNPGKIIDTKK